jgi:ATP-dependent RNA helicase DeaD
VPFPPTHPALASALAARDYSTPTPVQIAVLEASASSDLLVSARTGSGKTVAFGLTLASTLLGEAERFAPASGGPSALIIAPTRELALQVQRELTWLYAETGARIVTCVGGMDPRVETRALTAGTHIVVGTPGRLRDHLERKHLDLSSLRAVVLDEADEMLDLGFRDDLEFLLDATPETRRTLLFSATLPRAIVTLARRYQTEALRIATAGSEDQHSDIEYHAIRVASGEVEKAVTNVLRFHAASAALVFCATREAVKRMQAGLLDRGFSAVALSGELTQTERTHALQALREGRAQVLVATDVAARGLDLPDLSLVVHADLPNDPETLLHRSGRTGRAGRKGLCMLIVPYARRRKAETLLQAAKLRVRWSPAPTPEEIETRDHERFLAQTTFGEPATEGELVQVRALLAARSQDEIALALLRLHKQKLPRAETLTADTGPPRRADRTAGERPGFSPRPDGDRRPDDNRPKRAPRTGDRPMAWFRLNIGRAQNADPRWLLPLICRAGGVTKTEIGAIRIFDDETRFEIVAEVADAFALSARTAKEKQGHISRVGADAPEDAATVEAAISALETPPPRPPAQRQANQGRHTSLPLAERLAAKQEGGTKPSWRDRKREAVTPGDEAKSAGSRADGFRAGSVDRQGSEKPRWKDRKREAVTPADEAKSAGSNRADGFRAGPVDRQGSEKPRWKDRKREAVTSGDEAKSAGSRADGFRAGPVDRQGSEKPRGSYKPGGKGKFSAKKKARPSDALAR